MRKFFTRAFVLVMVVSLMLTMGVMYPLSGSAAEGDPVTVLLNSGNTSLTLTGFTSDAGYIYSTWGATLTVPVSLTQTGRYKMTVYMPYSLAGKHYITANGANKFVQTYADCNSWGQSVPTDIIVDLQSGANSILFELDASATTHMQKIVFTKVDDTMPLGRPDMLIFLPEDLDLGSYVGNAVPDGDFVAFRGKGTLTGTLITEGIITIPVTAAQSGRYKMTIYMFASQNGKHNITVNGGNRFVQTYADYGWSTPVPRDVIVDLQSGANSIVLEFVGSDYDFTHLDEISFTKVDDTTPLGRPDMLISLPEDLALGAYAGGAKPDNGFVDFREGGILTVPVTATQTGRYKMTIYMFHSASGKHTITVNGTNKFVQTYQNYTNWGQALPTDVIVDLQSGVNSIVLKAAAGSTTHMDEISFTKVDNETPLGHPDTIISLPEDLDGTAYTGGFTTGPDCIYSSGGATLTVPVTVAGSGRYKMTVYMFFSENGKHTITVNGANKFVQTYESYSNWGQSRPTDVIVDLQAGANSIVFKVAGNATTHLDEIVFTKADDAAPLGRPDIFVFLPGDLTQDAYDGYASPNSGFVEFRSPGTLTVPVTAAQSGRYRMVVYSVFSEDGVHSITVNGEDPFTKTYGNFGTWNAAGAEQYSAYQTLCTNIIVDLQQGENTVVFECTAGTTHMELLTFQKLKYEDVNLDGAVDILDSNLIKSILLNSHTPTIDELKFGDVNRDTSVDILDLLCIKDSILKGN